MQLWSWLRGGLEERALKEGKGKGCSQGLAASGRLHEVRGWGGGKLEKHTSQGTERKRSPPLTVHKRLPIQEGEEKKGYRKKKKKKGNVFLVWSTKKSRRWNKGGEFISSDGQEGAHVSQRKTEATSTHAIKKKRLHERVNGGG